MATIKWVSPTAKNFSDPTAWSGGIVPGVNDIADNDGTYTGKCTVDTPTISIGGLKIAPSVAADWFTALGRTINVYGLLHILNKPIGTVINAATTFNHYGNDCMLQQPTGSAAPFALVFHNNCELRTVGGRGIHATTVKAGKTLTGRCTPHPEFPALIPNPVIQHSGGLLTTESGSIIDITDCDGWLTFFYTSTPSVNILGTIRNTSGTAKTLNIAGAKFYIANIDGMFHATCFAYAATTTLGGDLKSLLSLTVGQQTAINTALSIDANTTLPSTTFAAAFSNITPAVGANVQLYGDITNTSGTFNYDFGGKTFDVSGTADQTLAFGVTSTPVKLTSSKTAGDVTIASGDVEQTKEETFPGLVLPQPYTGDYKQNGHRLNTGIDGIGRFVVGRIKSTDTANFNGEIHHSGHDFLHSFNTSNAGTNIFFHTNTDFRQALGNVGMYKHSVMAGATVTPRKTDHPSIATGAIRPGFRVAGNVSTVRGTMNFDHVDTVNYDYGGSHSQLDAVGGTFINNAGEKEFTYSGSGQFRGGTWRGSWNANLTLYSSIDIVADFTQFNSTIIQRPIIVTTNHTYTVTGSLFKDFKFVNASGSGVATIVSATPVSVSRDITITNPDGVFGYDFWGVSFILRGEADQNLSFGNTTTPARLSGAKQTGKTTISSGNISLEESSTFGLLKFASSYAGNFKSDNHDLVIDGFDTGVSLIAGKIDLGTSTVINTGMIELRGCNANNFISSASIWKQAGGGFLNPNSLKFFASPLFKTFEFAMGGYSTWDNDLVSLSASDHRIAGIVDCVSRLILTSPDGSNGTNITEMAFIYGKEVVFSKGKLSGTISPKTIATKSIIFDSFFDEIPAGIYSATTSITTGSLNCTNSINYNAEFLSSLKIQSNGSGNLTTTSNGCRVHKDITLVEAGAGVAKAIGSFCVNGTGSQTISGIKNEIHIISAKLSGKLEMGSTPNTIIDLSSVTLPSDSIEYVFTGNGSLSLLNDIMATGYYVADTVNRINTGFDFVKFFFQKESWMLSNTIETDRMMPGI